MREYIIKKKNKNITCLLFSLVFSSVLKFLFKIVHPNMIFTFVFEILRKTKKQEIENDTIRALIFISFLELKRDEYA